MWVFLSVISCIVFQIQGNYGKTENTNKCDQSCPNDWEEEGGRCYLWPNIKKTWHDAELYCNKEDGHLASVTNKRIHDYIWSKKKLLDKSTEFWIGGTDEEQEGNWRWADGSPWDFTFWGSTPLLI